MLIYINYFYDYEPLYHNNLPIRNNYKSYYCRCQSSQYSNDLEILSCQPGILINGLFLFCVCSDMDWDADVVPLTMTFLFRFAFRLCHLHLIIVEDDHLTGGRSKSRKITSSFYTHTHTHTHTHIYIYIYIYIYIMMYIYINILYKMINIYIWALWRRNLRLPLV